MASITLSGIHKAYGDAAPVIRDVNLQIEDGEFCVFVGPSGCGKSTLLRMIAGLEDISSGELRIGGKRVNELAPSERNVAMVFQNYALYPHMDVATNIGFGLDLAGHDKPGIKQRVHKIAEVLQIGALLARKPRELSGGQRQRVAIGRALVRDPGVFLFDEPLSNLDASLRTQTRVEIARLHRQYGRASTVYVTHDQVEAMTLADKIVLLHSGAAVAQYGSVAQVGAPLELYANPQNLFVAGFIGSPKMNLLEGEVAAIEPDGVLVRVGESQLIRAAVAPGKLAIGEKVTLGARSEHIQLRDNPDANTLPCRVQWVERLGDITYVYMRPRSGVRRESRVAHSLDDAKGYVGTQGQALSLVARLPGSDSVLVGDAVHLWLPPEACHLFDAQGQALRRLAP